MSLWPGTTVFGLTSVPLADMPPSNLIVAWNSADDNPLVRSFVRIAAAGYRSAPDPPVRSGDQCAGCP